jgi:energy-coupling factor transporter ATP-binding protein EcfA2
MINVYQKCGAYRADKIIDPGSSFAICPACQHKHRFRQLPLLLVCGPSGAGKSTICQYLMGRTETVVPLDADLLWQPEFNSPDDNYRSFYETWLRLGKNINQSGRPMLLFNAGAIPDNIEPCVERRYFGESHYLALVCDDDTLVERLRQRPAWRQSRDEAFIQTQLDFNRWFREHAGETEPAIRLVDTSHTTVEETVGLVKEWIEERA